MYSEISKPRVRPRSAWLAFLGFTLAATLAGCWAASAHGVRSPIWLLNLVAWSIGAALAAALARARLRVERWWPAVAIAGLASTFLSAGLSGVHRWINIGPVRLNSAELLLPLLVVSLAAWRGADLVSLLASVAIVAALALQPDASQAVAFAGGAIVATASFRRGWSWWMLAALLVATAVMACLRPDPLSPVPEVEGIIRLAAAVSPALAGLAVLALAGAVATPLLVACLHEGDRQVVAACGLSTYLGLAALAPAFGAFPVPLVGMGLSPILGAWLGFGCLMGLNASARGPIGGGAS